MTEQTPNNLSRDLPGEGLDAPMFTGEDRQLDARLAELIGGSIDAEVPEGLASRVFAASREHLPAPAPLALVETRSPWSWRTVASRVGMAACFGLVCTVLVWNAANNGGTSNAPNVADRSGDAVPSGTTDDGDVLNARPGLDVTFAIAPVIVPTSLDQHVLDSSGDRFHEADQLLGLTDIGYESLMGDMSQMLGSLSGQEM